MSRRRRYPPLRVLLNNRLVGHFMKAASGAIEFRYDDAWLSWENALPVSLSLPLREDAYRGAPVIAVFDNLLPDSDALRRRVAEKVGAAGIDAFSLLAAIGRDCVGALQFRREDDSAGDPGGAIHTVSGEVLNENAVEKLLKSLGQSPLGLRNDDPFRISVAGAQEKTALLWYEGQWLKPHGVTPTTHILKTQIGELPNGIDLSNSVENEYYCLKLAAAFGLPVNMAEIRTFGTTKALVIERFDRLWTKDRRLLRLPQEDCCQALSVPPSQKYQGDGGPDIVRLFNLLKGSDDPAKDLRTLLKAQIFFWLIGATDGHAKNFSIFLGVRGTYHMTPLYDILTAQPSLDARQIERKQMKLALSVGDNGHYRMSEICRRHFIQTGEAAHLPRFLVNETLAEIADTAERSLDKIGDELPAHFPQVIHSSVRQGTVERLKRLATKD